MSRHGDRALPFLVLALGLLESLHGMLRSGLGRVYGDPLDARHLGYVLEHGYRWLRRDPAHPGLFDMPVFHPLANTGAYSEILLGCQALYAPFRLLGLAPDTSLQLFLAAALVLNFAAAHVLLRRGFGFGGLPAAMGSWLFTFAALRVARLAHAHLVLHAFTLLAVLAVIEVLRRGSGRRTWIALFFGCLVAQVWSGFYFAWFFALALLVSALLALAAPAPPGALLRLGREEGLAVACGAALSALAVLPLARHYVEAGHLVGVRTWHDVADSLIPLKAWLSPAPGSWIYGRLASLPFFSSLPLASEKWLFPGVVTGALCAWGAWHGRARAGVRPVLLAGVTLAVLATSWPGGPSLWYVVYRLAPGASAIRAVSRLGLLLLLPAALALAVALRRLEEKGRGRLAASAALLVMLEQGQSPETHDKLAQRRDVQRIVAAIPPGCRSFYYSPIPPLTPPLKGQVDAMWASMVSGIPTVNGYSSNLPPGWLPLFPNGLAAGEDGSRLSLALAAWATRSGIPRESICWIRLPWGSFPEPGPSARVVSPG